MSWAQRLKRVFKIDIETCRACGGAVKVIACIEDAAVIRRILDHVNAEGLHETGALPEPRGPPFVGVQSSLFD